MEVAPAQLAVERLGAFAARQPRLDLAHGEAPEVQIRRQARRPVDRRQVIRVGIRAHGRFEEALEARPPGALTAPGRLVDVARQAERGERGHAAAADAGRQRRQRGGRRQHLAPRRLRPGAVERREHAVRIARCGAQPAEVVDGMQARLRAQLGPGRRELLAHSRGAPASERARVGGAVDLGGAGLARELGEGALGWVAPDHQLAAALTQGVPEVAEALEHERRPRARLVAAAQQAIVEAEHGDDALVRVQRGRQRRVVVQPKVASEPDECGHAGREQDSAQTHFRSVTACRSFSLQNVG